MTTSSGRVVALDPGSVRVGVAVCDEARTMAFPRGAIPSGPDTVRRLAALVREEGAGVVVVGLPVRLDGAEGPEAVAARELASALTTALEGLAEVVLHDERLTTVTAEQRLREAGRRGRSAREVVDAAAAVVLLESWLAR